jgi:hypothetical protein
MNKEYNFYLRELIFLMGMFEDIKNLEKNIHIDPHNLSITIHFYNLSKDYDMVGKCNQHFHNMAEGKHFCN